MEPAAPSRSDINLENYRVTNTISREGAPPRSSFCFHVRTRSMMRCPSALAGRMLCVLLLILLLWPAAGSLLPWIGRDLGSPLSERFPDPFRILEHIPFGLDRDDDQLVTLVAPARVDWKETPTSHEIMIDVPGLKIEDLKIEVEEDRILRVSGERKEEEEKKDEHWHRVERSYGKFWRQFRLPENVDLDSVSAKLQDGVLKVTFNKLAPERVKGPRVVSISASGGGAGGEINRAVQGDEGGGAAASTDGGAKNVEL